MENKILIDMFGGDNPEEMIEGVALALNEIEGVNLALVGDKEILTESLSKKGVDFSRIELIDAKQVITNDDKPIDAIRFKKDSSLVVGYNALKARQDLPVMITAGNTGSVMAGAILVLGRESRDDRAFLATFLPNDKGNMTCIADCGANVDCASTDLLSFAEHASKYMSKVYGIESPKIGLLSVGTEDKKGNSLSKEAFALLKASELNFVGNIEGKTVLAGDVDVVVCDGFTGNVLLKSIEGTAKTIVGRIFDTTKTMAKTKEQVEFVKSVVFELMQQLDFNSKGGAMLLGVKKPIIKAHGSANAQTVVSTIKQALRVINPVK